MKHPMDKGFTLMELLIGMALGLILTAVMVQIYAGARHSYLLQDGLSSVQEDGRVALHVISEEIRKAGHRKPVWNDPLVGYSPLTDASVNGPSGANDVLQLMYMDDMDCLGAVNAAIDPETNEAIALYKRVTFAVDNAENLQMSCEYGAAPDSLVLQADAQPIIDGVESFQVQYGIDTDFPPDFSINAWTTADTIKPSAIVCIQSQYLCEAGNLINDLREGLPVALKVGMLVASPQTTGTDVDNSDFTVLDVFIASKDDNRLRKAYTTTVTLRNLTL